MNHCARGRKKAGQKSSIPEAWKSEVSQPIVASSQASSWPSSAPVRREPPVKAIRWGTLGKKT